MKDGNFEVGDVCRESFFEEECIVSKVDRKNKACDIIYLDGSVEAHVIFGNLTFLDRNIKLDFLKEGK